MQLRPEELQQLLARPSCMASHWTNDERAPLRQSTMAQQYDRADPPFTPPTSYSQQSSVQQDDGTLDPDPYLPPGW